MWKSLMQLAINEAYKGVKAGHGGPFGAVIVKGAEVISGAHNCVLKEKDPTQHAEIRAISLASRKLGTFDLGGCVIYTTTEPCPMCFSAIHWARIDTVVYGTEIEDVRKLGFNELCVPISVMKETGKSPVNLSGGFMLEECRKLLEFWDKMPGKKVY